MARYANPGDPLAAAEEVLPIISAEAAPSEAAGRMTQPALRALLDRRLLRLLVPREYDGEETDLITALRLFELISAADGAAGWTVMIGNGAGLFAGFLEPAAAKEIFLAENAVVAGSGAPSGVARSDEGGYRVAGRWAYASGAHHATWFTANCVVEEPRDEAPVDGAPPIRSIAVPAAEVRVHETWSVSGMRGTGSDDIEIADAFVPWSHTFSVFEAPKVSGPLYRFPFFSIAELSFASVSLGIARHAIADFSALASRKRPMGSREPLAEDPDVQGRLARAEAAVGAARAYLFELASEAWETVLRGDSVAAADLARLRLASVHAVQESAKAVDLLYARAGMTPLFASSALGRAWRDVHAVTQNMLVSAALYRDCGRALLGRGQPAS